jgi:hypothetical protein
MKPTIAKSDICIAKKKDGTPCTVLHLPDSKYCGYHDPRFAQQRRLASSLGGQARHHRHIKGEVVPVKLRSVEALLSNIERVIAESWALDRSIARNKAIIAALTLLMKALEVGSLEERIRQLEEAVHGYDVQVIPAETEQEEIGETV